MGTEPVVTLAERPALRTAMENRRHVMVVRVRHDVPNEIAALDRVGANAMLCVPVTTSEQTPAAVQAFYLIAPDSAPSTEIIHRIQRMFLEYRSVAEEGATAHFLKLLHDVKNLVKADWVDYAVLSHGSPEAANSVCGGRPVWLDGQRPQIDLTSHPDLNEFARFARGDQLPCRRRDDVAGRGVAHQVFAGPFHSRAAADRTRSAVGMVVFADTEHAHRFSPRETRSGARDRRPGSDRVGQQPSRD
ncbi:MAG: hypothetical protein IPK17_04865 [Chloroflexi bacterium]|uniref:hypothetical protein n=1 Tax=Candidatus Flexifilum breve TaxID=3140694 RepID=UPI0031355EFD|nr:hypothetical protein [Chloroflexota bacterium]